MSSLEDPATQRSVIIHPLETLSEACEAVDGLRVPEASVQNGVPCPAPKDLLAEHNLYINRNQTVFIAEEEEHIVKFLTNLYDLGYGFSRADMTAVASEYAIFLRRRESDDHLKKSWIVSFMKRWPELIKINRKCAVSLSTILTNFYDGLGRVMSFHNFDVKPHLIFSVTDIEIRQDDVEGEDQVLTTVLACGSADGKFVPPFFVFPGKQMTLDLMAGALPGSSGIVSDTGLVNAEVFIQFLNEHLLNNIPAEEQGNPVLVHVNAVKFSSVALMELAKSQNIYLVFPPYEVSNALMPVDVGCIEPFQNLYTQECESYLQENSNDIGIDNVCEIVCKVYDKALTAKNITEGFKKAGLFPCNKNMLLMDINS